MKARLTRIAWIASAGAALGANGPALAQTPPSPPMAEEEVIITGSPLGGNPDRFATIVEAVSRDDILKSGGSNLADALSAVPGVAGTSFASGASRPVIRGMDSNRVKILEDGVGSSDVSDVGPDHGVPIDPLSARKIEVVRGAATLRYGSQAIGGVVNAINDRVPTRLPSEAISGEASASYASGAGAREGSLLLDGGAGKFAWHADGFVRHTGGYDIPGGTQANSFFRGDGYALGSSYFIGQHSRVGAALVHYDAQYGIPSDDTFIDMRQTKVLTSSSFALNAGALKTLNVDGGYADYVHDEIDPATGDKLSTFTNKEWDGRAEALFGALGPLATTAIGVQAQKRDFSAGGEGGDFLFPAKTRSGAVFAFTEAPLGSHLHLQSAVRVEAARIEGTPATNVYTQLDFTPISGSLGALFDASDALKLGLTFTSAARAPSQTELFARGAHDGPGTFETGDPSLEIERANSLEATMRVRLKRFEFNGSAWRAQFKNYIFGALTGNTCEDDGTCFPDDTHPLRELNYAQQDAAFYGLEGKATYTVFTAAHGALKAHALGDYVRATFADGVGNVPRIQPYRIGGGLSWEGDQFDAGFSAMHVGAQKDVPAGDTPTDDYAALDAQIAWRPPALHDGFEIALVGHNLTDDEQRNAVSLNRGAVVLPGRDIRLVLRQAF